jgi:hypothetical protein
MGRVGSCSSTPMHWAANRGMSSIVECLVKHNGSVYALNNKGYARCAVVSMLPTQAAVS